MRKAFNPSKLMGFRGRRKDEPETETFTRTETAQSVPVPSANDANVTGASRFGSRTAGAVGAADSAPRVRDQYSDILEDDEEDLASTYDSQEPEYDDEDEEEVSEYDDEYDDDEYDDDDYTERTASDEDDDDYDASTRPSGEYDDRTYTESSRLSDDASVYSDEDQETYVSSARPSRASGAARPSEDYTESSRYSRDDGGEFDEGEDDAAYASTHEGEPLDDDEYIDDDVASTVSDETIPADTGARTSDAAPASAGGAVGAAGAAGVAGAAGATAAQRATSPSAPTSGGLLRNLRRKTTAPPPDAPTTRSALGAQRRGFLSRLQRIGQKRQPEQPTAKQPDVYRSNSIVGRSRGAVAELERQGSSASHKARPSTAVRKDNAVGMRDRAQMALLGGGDADDAASDELADDAYVDYGKPAGAKVAGGAPVTAAAAAAPPIQGAAATPKSAARASAASAAAPSEPATDLRRAPSEYTSTSITPSHQRTMTVSSTSESAYSDTDYVSTVADSTRAMEAFDQSPRSPAVYAAQRAEAGTPRAEAPAARSEAVLLRDETRGRVPQLVDPFSKGMSLGRFSRGMARPESIEPSLFEADRDSAQPSSPLLPASGPLSGQRSSLDQSTSTQSRAAPPIVAMAPVVPAATPVEAYGRQRGHSANPSIATSTSDFQSARMPSSPGHGLQSPARISTRAPKKVASDLSHAERARMPKATGRGAAKRASKGADVPPVPYVPYVASDLSESEAVPPVPPLPPVGLVQATPAAAHPAASAPSKPRAPPNFRGLEHKTAHRRRSSHDPMKRRLPLPKEPQNYLLTPSVAPTETDPEETAAERQAAAPQAKVDRSWLMADLSAEEVHYFLRAIVGQELDWELDRAFLLTSFDKPVGRSRAGGAALNDGDSRRNDFLDEERTSLVDVDDDDEEAVFRRDVYEPVASSETVDLPLLRFVLKNAFCTFPLFVPPERRGGGGGGGGKRPPPNKAAIARSYFFAAILPILREWQARSLSAPIDRHGESDGTPFGGMSTTRAITMTLRKWTIRYITAVLRVGAGNPFYNAEQVHNYGWPWPSAQLLPPEAYVSYRKPTDRLRLGGFEVDVVAVRIHSPSDRDFLLRIRRPNRLDEFVVRNDTDFDEFHEKLAEELGPFVHLRPLPRLPGRQQLRAARPPTASSTTGLSSASRSADDDVEVFDEDDDEDTVSSTSYDDDASTPSYVTDSYDDDTSYDDDDVSTVRDGASRSTRGGRFGSRGKAPPQYEADRRLLRAWLRDTLAIRTIGESQEVRAFLSIGSFNDRELDTNELLNIAERRRGDCRRIEEREKDAELAGDNVLGIRRVMHRIWLDCVDGDGFLKVYDALRTTPNFWDLPMSYQTMVSWGNLQLARFLYGVFVQGDESRANLARVRDMFDAVPWKKLANAMRLPAFQMVGEWQKQFLRNRFMQTIFHVAFEDNPVAMDEDLRVLQQAINSDTMIRKLRAYVESPEDTKRLIRQHAERADIPLVAAIVRGSDHPKLSKAEVQRVILATRAYSDFLKTNPTAVKKKMHNDPGYLLIVDLQRVLRLYSLHRDVTQIRGMLQDPTILDALTAFFEPLNEALIRLHRVKGIRQAILDLRNYLHRLLDLLESLRARIQDPARSINMLAAFLDRGTPGWYNFVHRWSDADPVVFSTFAWFRHLAMTIGAGSEDLAEIWEPPLDLLEDPNTEPGAGDDMEQASTALRAASLAKLVAEGSNAAARPAVHPHLDETLLAEIRQLAEAARRKRARQMEIACRWSAGDTEGDFSIQVFGDGNGKMRSEPFLPKEPRPAPKPTAIERLRRSFREAVSSALAR